MSKKSITRGVVPHQAASDLADLTPNNGGIGSAPIPRADDIGPIAVNTAVPGKNPVARRARGRPFQKGQTGNPKGRPRGSRNATTLLIEALFEHEAKAVATKAVELARAGKESMIKLILTKLAPNAREPTAFIDIPPLTSPTACREAKARIAEAGAAGAISSLEAERQISNVDAVQRSFDRLEVEGRFEQRMADLEMSRLLAKYPHCWEPEESLRRYESFMEELKELNLSPQQFHRLWTQYYDRLSPGAKERIESEEREDESDG